MQILVPIHYPLTKHSKRTLERAYELYKEDPDTDLTILHVNLFHIGGDVSSDMLRKEVKGRYPDLNASYRVTEDFIVEEAIFREAVEEDVDMIIMGENQMGRAKRVVRKFLGNRPDIKEFLMEKMDIEIEVVR